MKKLREVEGPRGGVCNGCGGQIDEHVAEIIAISPVAGEVRRYHASCATQAIDQTVGRIGGDGAPTLLWLAEPEAGGESVN